MGQCVIFIHNTILQKRCLTGIYFSVCVMGTAANGVVKSTNLDVLSVCFKDFLLHVTLNMLYTEVENVASKISVLKGFDCWPEKESSVFYRMFSPILGPTHTLFMSGCQRLFWVMMWPGSEFDQLPPSSAKINNVWNFWCAPAYAVAICRGTATILMCMCWNVYISNFLLLQSFEKNACK